MRYADPDLCPDCRSDLPGGVTTCPTCSLPVRHTLAVELFATLTRADALVAQLRSIADAATAPAAARTAPALVPPGPAAPMVGAPAPTRPRPPPPPPPATQPPAPAPAPAPQPGADRRRRRCRRDPQDPARPRRAVPPGGGDRVPRGVVVDPRRGRPDGGAAHAHRRGDRWGAAAQQVPAAHRRRVDERRRAGHARPRRARRQRSGLVRRLVDRLGGGGWRRGDGDRRHRPGAPPVRRRPAAGRSSDLRRRRLPDRLGRPARRDGPRADRRPCAGRPRRRHHLAVAERLARPGLERRHRDVPGVERDGSARCGAGVRGPDPARRVGRRCRLVVAGVGRDPARTRPRPASGAS